tara:strand:+ start:1467 stop:1724 length:258 start_codon:yes stop_codon:yes gene_type:complete
MFSGLLKIFYFILIIIFFYFIFSTYFSENNISKIESKITNVQKKSEIQSYNLPIIKNDTDNVITYNSEDFIEKKIKKRKIWELLK